MKKKVTKTNNVEAKKAVTKPGHHMQHGPVKTFQQDGHWIEKPNKTAILLCDCGIRYLKTRVGQEKCLRCVAAAGMLAR